MSCPLCIEKLKTIEHFFFLVVRFRKYEKNVINGFFSTRILAICSRIHFWQHTMLESLFNNEKVGNYGWDRSVWRKKDECVFREKIFSIGDMIKQVKTSILKLREIYTMVVLLETMYLCVNTLNTRVVNSLKGKKKNKNKIKKIIIIDWTNVRKGSWIGKNKIKWEVNLMDLLAPVVLTPHQC